MALHEREYLERSGGAWWFLELSGAIRRDEQISALSAESASYRRLMNSESCSATSLLIWNKLWSSIAFGRKDVGIDRANAQL
jgi:hypothetical protein